MDEQETNNEFWFMVDSEHGMAWSSRIVHEARELAEEHLDVEGQPEHVWEAFKAGAEGASVLALRDLVRLGVVSVDDIRRVIRNEPLT